MKLVALLCLVALFSGSCTLMVGAAAGGAAGYYIGKEGYKIKVEKEKD